MLKRSRPKTAMPQMGMMVAAMIAMAMVLASPRVAVVVMVVAGVEVVKRTTRQLPSDVCEVKSLCANGTLSDRGTLVVKKQPACDVVKSQSADVNLSDSGTLDGVSTIR